MAIRKILVYLTVIALIVFSFLQIVSAGALTQISDTLTRLKTSTLSSHDILFTLAAANTFAAGETITIDFDEDGGKFTVAGATSVIADFDFNDGTERVIYNVGAATDCTGSVGVNDISVGIVDATGVVTFLACPAFTASGAAAAVNIEYGTAAGGTNRVTNPAAAANYVIPIAGTFGDTGQFAVVIIANDQVSVTATVDPSITFTISANSTAFGSLAVGLVTTSAPNITLTIGTNAANGYTITVKDEGDGVNPGLYNAAALHLIGSADAIFSNTSALVGGTEGYGLQAASAGATIGARFNGAGNTVGGLEVTGAPPTLASHNTSMGADHTITVTHKAAIGSWTQAGAYTDTITYIATGNF